MAHEYADGFIARTDSYHATLILPNLLRIINPHSGMKILEIGCGDGFFSDAFARAGAEVTGADIAEEMIARARTRTDAVTWHVAPADKLSFASDVSFDTAVVVLALQNIENLQSALAEATRVVVPGGSVVVVLNHPAFRIPKRSSWGWDEQAHVQYRRLDAYISESRETIDMDPGNAVDKRFTVSFHRPLQVYMKALIKNGFVIDGFEEWNSHKASEPGPRADAENTARKEFPLFLMLRARKIA